MLALRVGQTLLLATSALAVWARAYFDSATAASVDARVPWALPSMLVLAVVGQLGAAWLARRWPTRWSRLDLDDQLFLWVLAGLGLQAQSHVTAETTLRALREQIPAVLGLVHPLLVLGAPAVLRRLGLRTDGPDRRLLLTLALASLAGALHLLDGGVALMLALAVLLGQLAAGDGRLPRVPLVALVLGLAGLLSLATVSGLNRFHGQPALAWSLAGTAVFAAVAARPRSRDDLRRLLAAPVCAAVLLALCGLAVTAHLALALHWKPALETRLVLFRQHPNFLAPSYAFQALVALGLALDQRGASRSRLAWLAAAALLAASAWLTDSRAGQALLLLGLVALPALLLLRRLTARLSRRALLLGLGGTLLALVALLVGAHLAGQLTAGIDRFEKSMEYRVDAWTNALAVVRRWPGLGIGPGTFLSLERFAPGSRFFNEPTSPHPHNVLLYVAQSAGLPALLLFTGWLVAVLAGLWRWLRHPESGPGALLAASLTGATLGLLAANQLDVGLALQTVVPEPLFLLAGLLVAARPRAVEARQPPGRGLLWTAAALALALPLGLAPLRARTHLSQAGLLAFMASREAEPEALLARARAAGERALAADPYHEPTYELLSRWMEVAPQGFSRAREVLLQLVDLAPEYGEGHALLGQLYLRARMFGEASRELARAVDDGHGSVHQTRDRAGLIHSLCRLGRREEALDQLVEALHLDQGIIDHVDWARSPTTGEAWLMLPDDQRPIALLEAVEILFGRHVADEQAGRSVGRRNWMDTYRAFRKAGRDDRALQVLDFLEEHVPSVERWTLAHERGLLALDAGDCAGAFAHIQRALDMTGNPYYETELLRARRQCGEEVPVPTADGSRAPLLSELVEILDQGEVFEHALTTRAEGLVAQGRPAEAATWLRRGLLFADDPLERAEQLLAVARLALDGGALDASARDCAAALACLAAKAYPPRLLERDRITSLPLQVAEVLFRAWRAEGLDDEAVRRRAWGLPGFFGSRASQVQVRMACFAETGQMDALEREARMALMDDPADLLAHWFLVEALEGLGRHGQAADAMRDLSESFRQLSPVPVERLYGQLIRDGQSRQEDPRAWRDVALLDVLRGRYEEAAGLFARAADLLPTDAPRQRAALHGWQARALLLSGREGCVALAREALEQAVALAPEVGSHRRRLETLP